MLQEIEQQLCLGLTTNLRAITLRAKTSWSTHVGACATEVTLRTASEPGVVHENKRHLLKTPVAALVTISRKH